MADQTYTYGRGRLALCGVMQSACVVSLYSMTFVMRGLVRALGPDVRFPEPLFYRLECPHWTNRLGKSDPVSFPGRLVSFPGQQLAGRSNRWTQEK